jgi:hypothetical protein
MKFRKALVEKKKILGQEFDIEKIAQKFDVNKDGKLDAEEFSMFLDSIEARMSFGERDKALLIKLADKDGNDVIQLGEFFAFIKTDLGLSNFMKKAEASNANDEYEEENYDNSEEVLQNSQHLKT